VLGCPYQRMRCSRNQKIKKWIRAEIKVQCRGIPRPGAWLIRVSWRDKEARLGSSCNPAFFALSASPLLSLNQSPQISANRLPLSVRLLHLPLSLASLHHHFPFSFFCPPNVSRPFPLAFRAPIRAPSIPFLSPALVRPPCACRSLDGICRHVPLPWARTFLSPLPIRLLFSTATSSRPLAHRPLPSFPPQTWLLSAPIQTMTESINLPSPPRNPSSLR
jgi:hypothetical protein